jgi:hypothetical protein
MPNNKAIKKVKARSAGKRPASKTHETTTARTATPRSNSKQATVIALLSQPKGQFRDHEGKAERRFDLPCLEAAPPCSRN